MADGTPIEWTDATWNPITGCSIVSPGCSNCYAMKLAGTRLRNHPSRADLTIDSKSGPVWNGMVRFNEQWLTEPLAWRRPRRIFVCAHGDLFHEAVPDEWIDRVFAVMALSPQHQFQVLTKRADRMRVYMQNLVQNRLRDAVEPGAWPMTRQCSDAWLDPSATQAHRDMFRAKFVTLPLPNVWLGVSAERQKEADERIPLLLETPAAKRFVSLEPLLGPIDLDHIEAPKNPEDPEEDWRFNALATGDYYEMRSETLLGETRWTPSDGPHREHRLDWVIVGGESGSGARPMHPDWASSLRDQCAEADVPFFFKQWGNWKARYDRDRDDPDWRRCAEVAQQPGRWLNVAGGQGFHGDRLVRVIDIGKKSAGRLLDGREHNGMPA